MPCAGPNMPSESLVSVTTEVVLGFLQNNNILDEPYMSLGVCLEKRQEVIGKLKSVIREVLVQDACEKF